MNYNHLIILSTFVSSLFITTLSFAQEFNAPEGNFWSWNKFYGTPNSNGTSLDESKNLLEINDVIYSNRKPSLSPEEIDKKNTNIDGESLVIDFKKCFVDRKSKILKNYSQGKNIILNCFKAAIILKLLKYLISPNPNIKMLNGLLEFVKVQDPINCRYENRVDESEGCNNMYKWELEEIIKNKIKNKTNEYLFDKIVQKIVDEGSENLSSNESNDSGKRIEYIILETVRSFVNEKKEREEEEIIKRELKDPKFLSALSEFSKFYMLKLNLYPDFSLGVKRNTNGDISFYVVSDNSTQIFNNKESPEFDSDSNDTNESFKVRAFEEGRKLGKKGGSGNKNKDKNQRQRQKNKRKGGKKHHDFKHLLLPISLQLALLPFFLKNLFFLAIKALIAGKAALILIVFNLLRNAKVEDDNQKLRYEHYGYKSGEEYGAWINGRKFEGQPYTLNWLENPFKKQQTKLA